MIRIGRHIKVNTDKTSDITLSTVRDWIKELEKIPGSPKVVIKQPQPGDAWEMKESVLEKVIQTARFRIIEYMETHPHELFCLKLLMDLDPEPQNKKMYEEAIQVSSNVQQLQKELKGLTDVYRTKSNQVERDIRENQSKCPHPTTKYYPDASGNNDSSTKCLVCGKRW